MTSVTTTTSRSRRATDANYHQPSMSTRHSIVVVVPAYNEERFIGSVVLLTRKYADTVLVVDDGSTDATADVAEAAGALVVRHSANCGKGVALNTGLRYARERRPEIVVAIDADGQHLPAEIMRVVAPILAGEADIVVGSRYLSDHSRVPRHRVWGHRFFNFVTSRASGIPLSDSQSGYRAFSPRALNAISFQSDGFSVESEMQFLAHQYQLKMIEVPITIQYPDPPKRSVVVHGLMVLNGVLRLIGQYRPLLFMGLPGAILLSAGLLGGLWVMHLYGERQVLAVGYALLSTGLVIVGLLSLFTGIILHSVRGLLLDLIQPHHQPQPASRPGSS